MILVLRHGPEGASTHPPSRPKGKILNLSGTNLKVINKLSAPASAGCKRGQAGRLPSMRTEGALEFAEFLGATGV